MSLGEKIYRCIVIYLMPRSVNNYLTWAKGIYISMHNNTRYSALSVKIAKLNTDNLALDIAQTGFKAKPPTASKADRNSALKQSKKSIYALGGSVQEMADDDHENAEAIITEAGFGVKEIGIKPKTKNSADQGSEPNSVYVYGEGEGGHNWRMSTNGTDWVNLLASSGQRKIVHNLISLTMYHFQHSPVLPDGEEGKWSETISIRVN
ncbi:MAG: hypothetical protein WCH34_01885 [Bacteroidota bacterium]